MSRPPSPMLSVPEKKTAATELFRDRHFFNSAFFTDLREARASLSAPSSQATTQDAASRRALLLRYHRLLASARDDPCDFDDDLAFTWHDAFRPHLRRTAASLRFEKAAVVFNVGAASSRIAAAVDRAAEGGVKAACGEFQRAAGAFRAAGEMMEGEEEDTVDMGPEASAMLERLMLAQAQECCFERALAAGTSSAACSKVAKQAALYYEEAYASLVIPPLQNHFERSWVAHILLKAALFNAEASYRYAIELHEKTEIGEEIARLQFGINAIVDAKKAVRGAPGSLYDAASRLEQDMNQNLERALNENNRIYLLRVPAAKLLAPLPAASLVRSASLSEILDVKTETEGNVLNDRAGECTDAISTTVNWDLC
uniref:BRO1 domain-containing protein n=1 Tax=Oryza glumipatula TaxID=40148 RepID=A0A0D9YVH0_9ORYZ